MADVVSSRTAWIVDVNGQKVEIPASSTVIIGRKPLRAVSVPEGTTRVDVVDSTKSMSKNHAQISVNDNGEAVLADLNSTNGTYIRNSASKLLRIPAENPFDVPSDGVEGQFADVAFTMHIAAQSDESVDSDASGTAQPDKQPAVENLFSYKSPLAADEQPQSVMSVDDILDLRAGEPTVAFQTQINSREDEDDSRDDAAESSAEASSTDATYEDAAEPITSDEDGPSSASDEIAHEAVSEPSTDTGATELAALTEDSGYMPVYEPGSVFDRLSRGDFDQSKEIIEVDGHTSDEAKHTRDFNVQFDIAQIPQLRAFLAMNPFLYDDMFAWLEAQKDADIDSALESNEGFVAWKKGAK